MGSRRKDEPDLPVAAGGGLLAAASAIAIALGGCGSGSGSGTADALPIVESNLDTQVAQIGGATVAVDYYADATGDWVLYSMANRFAATKIGMTKSAATEISNLPGEIHNITVVPGRPIALLSMGEKGIGVVDITNPAAMVYRGTMSVNYTTPDIEYSDGGGNYLLAPSAELDVVATLAMLASRMKLGPSVLLLNLRNPLLTAKAFASLDYLSGGRMVMAVGTGSNLADYAACGIPLEGRGRRLDEGIQILRTVWREKNACFHGRFFNFDNVTIEPRPAARTNNDSGTIDIWVGGRSEAALKRTAPVASTVRGC